MLQEYNACQDIATNGNHTTLALADILDSATLAQIVHPNLGAYTLDKRELIDTYVMLKRSSEEVQLLECEMSNTICYYEHRSNVISKAVGKFSDSESAYDRGACAVLLDLLQATDQQLNKCRELFKFCFDHDGLSLPLSDDNYDSCDSEVDDDSDDND